MTPADLIAFEREIADAFNAAKIRAPVHLAGGNERALIDIFRDVKPEDWVLTTWRSHYHCLLKGVPRETLKADIMAGRSITLTYPSHRIVSSAIVGGIVPIALGLAWSIKRNKSGETVWCFVGDMAAATGIFSECEQYAAGHELPMRWVIENNGKSVCTDTQKVWGGEFGGIDVASERYGYDLPWPHSGAGRRVEF